MQGGRGGVKDKRRKKKRGRRRREMEESEKGKQTYLGMWETKKGESATGVDKINSCSR